MLIPNFDERLFEPGKPLEKDHCKECGTVYGETCRCCFDDKEYLNKLWSCYWRGIKEEKLPPKDLFIALIANLLRQVRGE